MTLPPANGALSNGARRYPVTIVAAVVAVVGFTAAAVLFVQGDSALERIAILVGIATVALQGLLSTLRGDDATRVAREVREEQRVVATQVNAGVEVVPAIAEATAHLVRTMQASGVPVPAQAAAVADRLDAVASTARNGNGNGGHAHTPAEPPAVG